MACHLFVCVPWAKNGFHIFKWLKNQKETILWHGKVIWNSSCVRGHFYWRAHVCSSACHLWLFCDGRIHTGIESVCCLGLCRKPLPPLLRAVGQRGILRPLTSRAAGLRVQQFTWGHRAGPKHTFLIPDPLVLTAVQHGLHRKNVLCLVSFTIFCYQLRANIC